MLHKNKTLWLSLLFSLLVCYSEAHAQIWSNEIHYQNIGVDEGERIELAGLAGTSLSGWSVVLYDGGNGSNGAPYGTAVTLTGVLPAANCTVNGQGIALYVIDVVAATGQSFQGGASFTDGWALIKDGVVIELLSYGGTFTATSGPANGMTSVDIGAIEPNPTAIGSSIQRTGATTWVFADGTNTFGACNTTQYNPNAPQPPSSNAGPNRETNVSGTATMAAIATNGTGAWSIFSGPSTSLAQLSSTSAANTVFTPAGGPGTYVLRWTVTGNGVATDDANVVVFPNAPPANQQLFSNEIHYVNAGSDMNERIELAGPAGTSLANWRIQFYEGSDGSVYATYNFPSGTLPNTCTVGGENIGVVVVDVVAATGFSFSNGPDGWALVYGVTPIEFLSYGGTFTATNGLANGMTSVNINATEPDATSANSSIQRTGTVTWVFAEATNTFGACNSTQYNPSGPQPPVANAGPDREISVSGTATTAAIATNGTGEWTIVSGPSTSLAQLSSTSAANTVFTPAGGAGVYTLRWTVSAMGFPSVSDDATVTVYPLPPSICNQIFSNEIHYHNAGTDVNEKIEVAGPAGTDLTNWKIQLYEGSTGAIYATANLSGTLPNTCTINGINMGVAILDVAAIGSSLGSGPDGWSLVFGATPVEFFSYSGTFTATNGFAAGMTSTDIGATEPSTTSGNSSIQRSGATSWVFAEGTNTFGACNTTQFANAIPSCSVTGAASVCNNTTGNVYTGTAGMSNYSWSISGNGAIIGSTTGSSVTVTAGAAGTYTVNVTVTNASGCTNTCNQVVTVSGQPACSVTGPATVCPSATSTFNAPAGLSMYSWTVTGNGSISGAANGASVNVDAQASGTYTVNVTVTNATGCTSTCNRVVNISTLPDATITGGGTYCGGTSVSLSAPAGAASYAWGKFDNNQNNPGFPQIGTGNPFSVTKSGYYSVTVTNAAGCSAVGFTNVVVADYVINGSLGPGDSQKGNRLLRIGASGVTCAVPKSCPGTVGVGEVHYYDVHNFTNTQNVPVCVNIALNSPCGTNIFMAAYSAPFNPANTCANYLGDPATSFFASQTGTMEVTVPANGTLSVLVEVVPNGGTCSDYTLGVDILAAFPGLTVTAPNTACQGTAFNLSANAFSNATYSWAGSGVTASSTNATTATPGATGSQTYTVTVSTASGCKPTTATKVVSVNTVPSCPSGFGPPVNGQTGVTFLDSLRWTPVTNITHYLVYFGNNAPNYDNILNGVNNGTSNSRGMSLTLIPNTTYGYRIVPVNTCGQAVGCPTITFSTCLPSFTCPANRNVNLNASCGMVIPDLVTGLAANPGCGSLTFTQSPTANTVVPSSHNGTVLVTITPNNMNVASCQVTLTGKDVTPPTVVCQPFTANLSTAGTASITTANVFQSGADNCGTVNQVQVMPSSFTCANLGANTVTLTVNDGNGNTATCSTSVTVRDLIAPTMTCRPATIDLNASGQATLTTALVNNGSTDNCTLTTLALSQTAFSCVNLGANTVVLTGTDQSANSATCSASVTVRDLIAPTMTCRPATIDLNASGQATLTTALVNNGSTDNCTLTTLALSQTAFTCANLGANTVILTGTDQSGNSATCSASVTVRDNILPTVTCKNFTANLNAAGTASIATGNVFQTGSDNCSIVNFSVLPNTFTCANNGDNTVVLTVSDAASNSATCAAIVTVADATAPTIICPANIIRANDLNQCGAAVAYVTPTASDNCAGAMASHFSGGVSGAVFQKGTTTVVWRATDGAGLTGSCSFSITVNDTQKPNITCPANQTRSTDLGLCSAVVTYPTPTGTDNCGLPTGQPIWISGGTNASGSTATFQKGINTVTWRATDGAGLTNTCTFRVTVNDTEAPTMTCPAALNLNTAPNTCSAVATYTNPTFTDNCAPTTGTAVRISGLVSGSAFPAGNSNVVFQATDASGNTRRCTMVVTVTDNQPPVINCPLSVVATGTGTPCSAIVFYGSTTASDNCAGTLTPFLVTGLASGSTFPAGVTTNTVRAVAPNGQSSECSFSVTVDCGSGMGNNGVEVRDADLSIQHGTHLELKLSPNPALSTVTVGIEGVGAGGGALLVFDAVGRLVLRQVVAENQRTAVLQVDGSEFAPGLYRVNLRTETGMVTKTLVVVK